MQENSGQHIDHIVNNFPCGKHGADVGTACWHIYIAFSRRFAPAVCGSRIKKAGFTGQVSPSSLSLRAPGGRNSGPRRRA